jgi:hypothetical protein
MKRQLEDGGNTLATAKVNNGAGVESSRITVCASLP